MTSQSQLEHLDASELLKSGMLHYGLAITSGIVLAAFALLYCPWTQHTWLAELTGLTADNSLLKKWK